MTGVVSEVEAVAGGAMKLADLSPTTWVAKLEAGAAALAVAGALVGGFVLHERHVGAASQAPKVEAARDQADIDRLNLKGAQDSAARVDAYQHLTLTLKDAIGQAVAAAGAAPDAHAPLDPARADRLRAFDGELCKLRPEVCPRTPAAGGDAGAGAGGVRPAAPPHPGDAG